MTQAPLWQKSSFSGFGDGNDCVELATDPDDIRDIRLRESDTPTTQLQTTPASLTGLLLHLKAGRRHVTAR
ncbi:DUF397 domain-containing protein [Streptomyces neyagawaensis]|uniref:DUF397 domain-containing protein n=1 Tax=Streptomyces neyagawaensis TaxID=42238 RepID=A0ABV3AZ80_9ACTN